MASESSRLSILTDQEISELYNIPCFTEEDWGVLEAKRQRRGRPLHVPDGQIAATALEHGLTLVTRNTKDFAQLG